MTRNTNEPANPGGRSKLPLEGQLPKPEETTESGVQGSAAHGFREDDALKRIIKQHPQKGIPQVESMEPQEAPPKE